MGTPELGRQLPIQAAESFCWQIDRKTRAPISIDELEVRELLRPTCLLRPAELRQPFFADAGPPAFASKKEVLPQPQAVVTTTRIWLTSFSRLSRNPIGPTWGDRFTHRAKTRA